MNIQKIKDDAPIIAKIVTILCYGLMAALVIWMLYSFKTNTSNRETNRQSSFQQTYIYVFFGSDNGHLIISSSTSNKVETAKMYDKSYLYWQDTNGVNHQHYITDGQIIHLTDRPLKLSLPDDKKVEK